MAWSTRAKDGGLSAFHLLPLICNVFRNGFGFGFLASAFFDNLAQQRMISRLNSSGSLPSRSAPLRLVATFPAAQTPIWKI